MKKLNKKKMILGITITVIAIVAATVVTAIHHNENHPSEKTINAFTLERIDDYSPDRKIIFYTDNERVSAEEISEIRLSDGTVLCRGEPFVVNAFELENESTITIITNANKELILTKK